MVSWNVDRSERVGLRAGTGGLDADGHVVHGGRVVAAGPWGHARHTALIGRYRGCHMASCTCCTGSVSVACARFSSAARLATATATVADTMRRFSTCGSRDAPGVLTSTRPTTAS